MADTRKLSIRRGQVWTSLVRIAADARAEEHRARMMREADEHAKALALAVEDEEICACRLAVTWTEHVPVFTETHMVGGVVESRTLMVGTALLEANLRDAQREVDRLRATSPKVPPPRPGAERFEAPLVRDRATARAMERNKYEFAPAGTRAAHKRTGEVRDITAALLRTGNAATRVSAQAMRRAGFSPREIHLLLWEPLRLYRETVQFGGAVTLATGRTSVKGDVRSNLPRTC